MRSSTARPRRFSQRATVRMIDVYWKWRMAFYLQTLQWNLYQSFHLVHKIEDHANRSSIQAIILCSKVWHAGIMIFHSHSRKWSSAVSIWIFDFVSSSKTWLTYKIPTLQLPSQYWRQGQSTLCWKPASRLITGCPRMKCMAILQLWRECHWQ